MVSFWLNSVEHYKKRNAGNLILLNKKLHTLLHITTNYLKYIMKYFLLLLTHLIIYLKPLFYLM